MKRRRYKPTLDDFETYYRLKCNGYTDYEIAKELGISTWQMFKYKPLYRMFCARKTRKERLEKNVVRKGPVPQIEKYRLAAIKLAELGESRNQIAERLGIPESTLRQWEELDETFGHAMRTAKDAADCEVIRSLLRRAQGFTTREATRNIIRDGHGNVVQQNVTEHVFRVFPNVKAIELWLTNRRKWMSDVQGTATEQGDSRPVEYEIVHRLFEQPIYAEREEKNIHTVAEDAERV